MPLLAVPQLLTPARLHRLARCMLRPAHAGSLAPSLMHYLSRSLAHYIREHEHLPPRAGADRTQLHVKHLRKCVCTIDEKVLPVSGLGAHLSTNWLRRAFLEMEWRDCAERKVWLATAGSSTSHTVPKIRGVSTGWGQPKGKGE